MASSHNHPHPHHAHGHDYASANQAFFDQHAHEADQRHGAGELAKDIRDAILQAYKFDDQSTTLLDFACGTGIVSLGLAERCKKVVGVDISQGMVDQYNKNAAERDISSQALRIELKGEDSELDGTKFDVVMCSLAYHHIQDIVSTTRLLSFFLKPGGVLLIVDFPTMDISKFPADVAKAMIAHTHGVSQVAIREAYDKAGLGQFEWREFKGPKSEIHPEDVFITKGVKV